MTTAAGGSATVVVPLRDTLLPLAWVNQPADDELFPNDGPIHPDSTLGLLTQYMETTGTGHYTFKISAESPEVAVTEGERLSIPA